LPDRAGKEKVKKKLWTTFSGLTVFSFLFAANINHKTFEVDTLGKFSQYLGTRAKVRDIFLFFGKKI
jgi:hypothetical protein